MFYRNNIFFSSSKDCNQCQRGDRGFETVLADPRGQPWTQIRTDICGEKRELRIEARNLIILSIKPNL